MLVESLDLKEMDHKAYTEQLFKALRFGLMSDVTILLDSAGDGILNSTDAQGNTPMHWAARCGDTELMKTLVHHGAAINEKSPSDSRMQPIHWAASEGKISSIRFLVNSNVDIDSTDANGCTPLVIAAQHNQIPCVVYLIKSGANVEVADTNGDLCSHWAAYKGNLELLGALAYLRPQDMHAADKYGQTPLHLASLRGNVDCVEYLVTACRCDMTLKDRNGATAIDLAIKKGHRKVEWFLRKASSRTIFHEMYAMGTQKLCSVRSLGSLLCGYNDKELMNWPWRVVFFSNLTASILTAYFVSDSAMGDLTMLHAANFLFQGFWWFCFLMCLFTSSGEVVDLEPGKVRDRNATYENALEVIGASTGEPNEPDYPPVCHSCHVRRPIRAKHCKILGKCIHRFDHFCPFVANTVGRDNYKYFVGLLCAHVVCGTLWEITAYWYSCRVSVSWQFYAFMVYSAMWMLAIGGLFNYHMSLIMNALTTNEQIGFHKYAYFKNNEGLLHNPFDRGNFILNLLDAIFPSQMVYYSRQEYLEYERPHLVERSSTTNSGIEDREDEKSMLLQRLV
mmetsp:Transcript_21475/g.31148  ORF Transcript_21475/g.31148 Transcript_21475/m.31148 type:complete len:564 (-) Transcript_21475:167-1858(-)